MERKCKVREALLLREELRVIIRGRFLVVNGFVRNPVLVAADEIRDEALSYVGGKGI